MEAVNNEKHIDKKCEYFGTYTYTLLSTIAAVSGWHIT
jgi:hypothetical protein